LPELWGSDAFVQLAVLARETDSIVVGTAITNVFSRSAAAIAMVADLAVAGTPADVRGQLEALAADRVGVPVTTVPKTATDMALDTIDALAPQ
jgi:alkanesulfonate monooxygenase SsuD/methylene tetrahydromethanopterin reductase-like flavin-dependent oxidoreductase (luciferase family)